MSSTIKSIQNAGVIIGILGAIGFTGLIWLMIYGNLSGNLGFASGTTGYNNTELVINNLTLGYTTFFGFSPTLFTIAAIVLLITMFVGVAALAWKFLSGTKEGGGGGFSGY